jgi:pyruvate dehydrogenase (quinone)
MALVVPPKVSAEQVRGFALAMTRIVLEGEATEAIGIARAGLRYLPRG